MLSRKTLGDKSNAQDAKVATLQWTGPFARLFLLQHAAPSRLWLGVEQRFGMVEQSQEYQLAMPFVCSTALLFRRGLSAANRSRANGATRRHASRLWESTTA